MNFLTAKNLDEFVEANRDLGGTLWVFHHLPKTAGSSIIQELSSRLQPNRVVHAYAQLRDLTYEQSIDLAFGDFARTSQSVRYRFVAGHFERHHIQWFRGCERAKIFAFLRDPLARIVSEYRYQQTSASPGYRQFLSRFPSFDHYLSDDTRRNPMVRALSGTIDVKRCVAILEADYVLCGITELYRECTDLLFGLMGDRSAEVERVNVTPALVPNEVNNPESYRSIVLALNRADADLYEIIRDRVYDRIS